MFKNKMCIAKQEMFILNKRDLLSYKVNVDTCDIPKDFCLPKNENYKFDKNILTLFYNNVQ